VKWLTDHGIARSRLRSAGIGMDRPIATNDDEVGRQTNRRVEFHIKGAKKQDAGGEDAEDDVDETFGL
jgi:outer membrane protein OmpA-like peptidoglycan-associated protein